MDVTDGEACRDPLGEAVRTDEQLPGGEAQPFATGLLLDLTVAGALLVAGEGGTEEARDLVLGDQPTDLVRGDAREQHVPAGKALGQRAAGGPSGEQGTRERRAERSGEH